jgi:acyl-CoA thioesterase FadM
MARVSLELPETFLFTTELAVRVTDINFAGHVGNDTLLSLLQEARSRFLAHYGLKDLDLFGLGMVITDAVVVYQSEAFHGDTLSIAVTVQDFNKYGCDFVYRVTEQRSGRAVARAKTGMVFFDYRERRVQPVPAPFLTLFGAVPASG